MLVVPVLCGYCGASGAVATIDTDHRVIDTGGFGSQEKGDPRRYLAGELFAGNDPRAAAAAEVRKGIPGHGQQ
jgi:hypothetical protein